ncbi:hypothetical protein ALEK_2820 [Poseidonibacter lekithochrous]|nr:hypothetical protein ALEK_2820 [Poseidonibacter lekithochrous]
MGFKVCFKSIKLSFYKKSSCEVKSLCNWNEFDDSFFSFIVLIEIILLNVLKKPFNIY